MTERTGPNVYIVAGPNGAGKSTFARLFLPEYADCREFVNADLIAAGLSPFNPESLAIQAGRLMLERIEALSQSRADFGFETTLAGRGYVPLLSRLRSEGYRIHLFFLWLTGPDLALSRVRDRVRAGGHDVPKEVVRRRFTRGLANLFRLYEPLLDSTLIFDNSMDEPRMKGMTKPIAEIDLPPLVAKADRAMKEAVAAAIAEHWRAGRPVHIWQDEQVVALYPDGTTVPANQESQE